MPFTALLTCHWILCDYDSYRVQLSPLIFTLRNWIILLGILQKEERGMSCWVHSSMRMVTLPKFWCVKLLPCIPFVNLILASPHSPSPLWRGLSSSVSTPHVSLLVEFGFYSLQSSGHDHRIWWDNATLLPQSAYHTGHPSVQAPLNHLTELRPRVRIQPRLGEGELGSEGGRGCWCRW